MARGRREAGAALHGGGEAGRARERDLDGRTLNVGVHGRDTRVVLLDDVVVLHALGALHHGGVEVGNINGDAVSVRELLHAIGLHLGEVGKGSRGMATNDLAVGSLAGDNVHGPSHGRLRGTRGLVRVRSAVIQEIVGVETTVVRSALVLDHGGLAAEALEATLMAALVRTLAGVDAAVAGETGGL